MGVEAYAVAFTLNAQPRARVIIWVYPAEEVPGSGVFVVAYRCRQEHGPWTAAGWHAIPGSFTSPQDATDAALDAAVALACGSFEDFPGGTPACLLWDGVPW